MRRLSSLQLACVLVAAMPPGLAGADPLTETLHHNPFERPPLAEPADTAKQSAVTGAPKELPVLSGTLVSSTAPMAILDGKLLGLGGEHDGYRLVAVEEGAAVFDYQGERVEFKVDVEEEKGTTGRRR